MKEIKVQTGGKLYLAGEYAVLQPGQTAIIKNIPIYMTASISPADKISLSSDMFNYSVDMMPDQNYALIQETIKAFATYIKKNHDDLSPFSLTITGKMERDGKKFGIGSSGSVTVLVLKALSALYDLNLSAEIIFKLASYTLIKLGDNGSMGDIACITYDDLVAFTAFDRDQVRQWMQTEDLQQVLARDWGYQIEVIKPALSCDFLVGWTKQPSISKDMINLVKSAIDQNFLEQTQAQVLALKAALLLGQKEKIKEALEEISQLLQDLHPSIYNDKLLLLKKAAQGLDAVAKSSGSGGGDCGIALTFDEAATKELIARWQEAYIDLLDLEKL